jgi:glutamate-5-semialdehyde dehydrogenase
MNSSKDYTLELCKSANIARDEIAIADSQIKNKVLTEVIKLINSNRENILLQNKLDLTNAQKNNLDLAKIDRLAMDNDKINSIIKTLEEIIKLDDPVGKIIYQANRDNGLNIKRISTPIGLFLAIYEARPNVTSDISALSLKSGNAVILRSSKDCYFSSKIIAELFRNALIKFNLNPNIISFVEDSSYETLNKLLKMNKFIDVVIPRGGKNLINFVIENSNIAMFNHLDGNCHTYINQHADLIKANKILFNAKMRRTSICGATETVLIDRQIASQIIPIIVDDLTKANCEIRGDHESQIIDSRIKLASQDDYYTEFLDKILALKIVDNCDEAIAHIAKYGSSHTESIITEDEITAQKFFKMVNSAIVMHNASTQFADGYEFGMGGEVGIATGKLHARGPIGLEQLTTFKYLVSAKCGIRS